MGNITISKRITFMVIISIIALLLVGAVGLFVSNKQTNSIKQVKEDSLASIETLGEAPLTLLCCCAPAYDHADTELLEAAADSPA